MSFNSEGFDRSVPLPPGLNLIHLKNAIDFVEERAEELLDLYFEQANIFSAVVGIFGVRALDSLSPYKRHRHPDIAQQRFPDLSLRGRSTLLLAKPLSPKAVRDHGRFNRIMTIPAGTSFGDMRLTRPKE